MLQDALQGTHVTAGRGRTLTAHPQVSVFGATRPPGSAHLQHLNQGPGTTTAARPLDPNDLAGRTRSRAAGAALVGGNTRRRGGWAGDVRRSAGRVGLLPRKDLHIVRVLAGCPALCLTKLGELFQPRLAQLRTPERLFAEQVLPRQTVGASTLSARTTLPT